MKNKFIFFISLILVSAFIFPIKISADEISEENIPYEVFSSEEPSASKSEIRKVEAGSAVAMEYESGRVLYEKNARVKRYIASTTKIITAIVAIEKGNLNDTVTVSKRAAEIWGSNINLKEGEKIKLSDLLYGLMMRSGNDAAIAIAEHIGGSVENFAQMMNEKAKEIGAYDSNFKTPHGLDVEGHYSTAYDLALITRYAIQNPTFAKIVSTKQITIGNRVFENTNEMLGLYPGADGVKTGYTGLAGRCLVTSAKRNNMRVISVVLYCQSRAKRAESSRIILDYSFNNFKKYTLVNKEDNYGTIKVLRGKKPNINVKPIEDKIMPLSDEEIAGLQKEVELPESLQAPVYAGIEVGKVIYKLNGSVMAEVPLKTVDTVQKKDVKDYLKEIFIAWGRLMRK